MSDFDDIFGDDNPDVVTGNPSNQDNSDEITLEDGETYTQRLEREKGLTDPEEIAKSALYGDRHIKKLENEHKTYQAQIQQYDSWIKNNAAPAVKLAKEYINSDAYKQKYGLNQNGQSTGVKPADASKDNNAEFDLDGIVNKVAERINPTLNNLGNQVSNLSEKDLIAEMKQDTKRFPWLTEEVEKDMKQFLNSAKRNGNPYPATAVAMANLYNSFVGKNIDKVIEAKKDVLRRDILNDIQEGNDSYTESDRMGEEGIANLDEDAKDIAAMYKAHNNPLSFQGIK